MGKPGDMDKSSISEDQKVDSDKAQRPSLPKWFLEKSSPIPDNHQNVWNLLDNKGNIAASITLRRVGELVSPYWDSLSITGLTLDTPDFPPVAMKETSPLLPIGDSQDASETKSLAPVVTEKEILAEIKQNCIKHGDKDKLNPRDIRISLWPPLWSDAALTFLQGLNPNKEGLGKWSEFFDLKLRVDRKTKFKNAFLRVGGFSK